MKAGSEDPENSPHTIYSAFGGRCRMLSEALPGKLTPTRAIDNYIVSIHKVGSVPSLVCFILLLLAGDIELNLGPTHSYSVSHRNHFPLRVDTSTLGFINFALRVDSTLKTSTKFIMKTSSSSSTTVKNANPFLIFIMTSTFNGKTCF